MTSTFRTSFSLSLASSPSSSFRYGSEGWDILDSVLVAGLLVVCGSHDWKRVAGIGVPVTRGEKVEEGMAVGEEMVTGLDSWTSSPELVETSASGSGIYTPQHLGQGSGAVTQGGLLAVGEEGGLGVGGTTPVRSGTPVPPPPSLPPYLL
ncbi:hypothetical protein RhiJN_22338 [Ceratobasidium sp. AG-Ba]|nr:hypothetical protein RhiJN_22338 [Ceratobasidium sp. AG-Ba]